MNQRKSSLQLTESWISRQLCDVFSWYGFTLLGACYRQIKFEAEGKPSINVFVTNLEAPENCQTCHLILQLICNHLYNSPIYHPRL